ncbi:hypothetical protein DL93DRAFT_115722 [Clavulina sp. PMI_390]|nr:hypothetical protein DL93DRAFT_115722 [Clavulina sp. PMI_390]
MTPPFGTFPQVAPGTTPPSSPPNLASFSVHPEVQERGRSFRRSFNTTFNPLAPFGIYGQGNASSGGASNTPGAGGSFNRLAPFGIFGQQNGPAPSPSSPRGRFMNPGAPFGIFGQRKGSSGGEAKTAPSPAHGRMRYGKRMPQVSVTNWDDVRAETVLDDPSPSDLQGQSLHRSQDRSQSPSDAAENGGTESGARFDSLRMERTSSPEPNESRRVSEGDADQPRASSSSSPSPSMTRSTTPSHSPSSSDTRSPTSDHTAMPSNLPLNSSPTTLTPSSSLPLDRIAPNPTPSWMNRDREPSPPPLPDWLQNRAAGANGAVSSSREGYEIEGSEVREPNAAAPPTSLGGPSAERPQLSTLSTPDNANMSSGHRPSPSWGSSASSDKPWRVPPPIGPNSPESHKNWKPSRRHYPESDSPTVALTPWRGPSPSPGAIQHRPPEPHETAGRDWGDVLTMQAPVPHRAHAPSFVNDDALTSRQSLGVDLDEARAPTPIPPMDVSLSTNAASNTPYPWRIPLVGGAPTTEGGEGADSGALSVRDPTATRAWTPGRRFAENPFNQPTSYTPSVPLSRRLHNGGEDSMRGATSWPNSRLIEDGRMTSEPGSSILSSTSFGGASPPQGEASTSTPDSEPLTPSPTGLECQTSALSPKDLDGDCPSTLTHPVHRPPPLAMSNDRPFIMPDWMQKDTNQITGDLPLANSHSSREGGWMPSGQSALGPDSGTPPRDGASALPSQSSPPATFTNSFDNGRIPDGSVSSTHDSTSGRPWNGRRFAQNPYTQTPAVAPEPDWMRRPNPLGASSFADIPRLHEHADAAIGHDTSASPLGASFSLSAPARHADTLPSTSQAPLSPPEPATSASSNFLSPPILYPHGLTPRPSTSHLGSHFSRSSRAPSPSPSSVPSRRAKKYASGGVQAPAASAQPKSAGDAYNDSSSGSGSIIIRLLVLAYGITMLELTIVRNNVGPGENVWGFGQIVSVIIALGGANEMLQFFMGKEWRFETYDDALWHEEHKKTAKAENRAEWRLMDEKRKASKKASKDARGSRYSRLKENLRSFFAGGRPSRNEAVTHTPRMGEPDPTAAAHESMHSTGKSTLHNGWLAGLRARGRSTASHRAISRLMPFFRQDPPSAATPDLEMAMTSRGDPAEAELPRPDDTTATGEAARAEIHTTGHSASHDNLPPVLGRRHAQPAEGDDGD